MNLLPCLSVCLLLNLPLLDWTGTRRNDEKDRLIGQEGQCCAYIEGKQVYFSKLSLPHLLLIFGGVKMNLIKEMRLTQ